MNSAARDTLATSNRAIVRFASLSIIVLLGGFGFWATQTKLASAISVHGQITSAAQPRTVEHEHGGRIDHVFVTEGEAVTAGDALFTLASADLEAELNALNAALSAAKAKRARLLAEQQDASEFATPIPEREAAVWDTQKTLFLARLESHQNTLAQMRVQYAIHLERIAALRSQMAAQKELLSLAQQEVDTKSSLLAKGLAKASILKAAQREVIQINSKIGAIASDLANIKQAQAALALDQLRLKSQRRSEATAGLETLEPELKTLEEQVHLARADRDARTIRAPISGVIQGAKLIGPDMVLRPAEPALSVVPDLSEFRARLKVLPQDIGEVFVGQAVSLVPIGQLPARDYRGVVLAISADVLRSDPTGQPYFEVTVRPAQGAPSWQDLPRSTPLKGYIRTRDRTALAYLIAPLSDYVSAAFRES